MSHKSSSELQSELDIASKQLEIGSIYTHFRGQNYRITGVVIIEATSEVGVVYQAEYGEHITFVRPLRSFLEQVEQDGRTIPRFASTK